MSFLFGFACGAACMMALFIGAFAKAAREYHAMSKQTTEYMNAMVGYLGTIGGTQKATLKLLSDVVDHRNRRDMKKMMKAVPFIMPGSQN